MLKENIDILKKIREEQKKKDQYRRENKLPLPSVFDIDYEWIISIPPQEVDDKEDSNG